MQNFGGNKVHEFQKSSLSKEVKVQNSILVKISFTRKYKNIFISIALHLASL